MNIRHFVDCQVGLGMKLLLPSLLLLASAGCVNMPATIRALSHDQALTAIDVRTVTASGRIVRDGRPNNGTTISDSGAVASIQPTNNAVLITP